MSDFLQSMAQSSRRRAQLAAARWETLRHQADSQAPAPALRVGEFGVIAELKRRSPAEGVLAVADEDRLVRAAAYETGGAAAVSVLTEPDRFDGSLDDLAAVAGALNRAPAMRKDFIVDDVQLLEARAAGAGGVLLIAAILPEDELHALTATARALGLFVLLEAFDSADLARCSGLVRDSQFVADVRDGQILVGINTRDLRTLEVDPDRLRTLAPELPAEAIAVAESGVLNADDARRVAMLGYRAALVGTALMRAAQPATLLNEMLAAGRAVVS